MTTNIITVDEAIANGTWKWDKDSNDCEFKGYVPGYVCGWCAEIKKDGKVDYCSCTFTNDFDEIHDPEICRDWNDLGISVSFVRNFKGWEPTGNIVFRGYYTSEWDFEEREECFCDASKEVIDLFDKYCVA